MYYNFQAGENAVFEMDLLALNTHAREGLVHILSLAIANLKDS